MILSNVAPISPWLAENSDGSPKCRCNKGCAAPSIISAACVELALPVRSEYNLSMVMLAAAVLSLSLPIRRAHAEADATIKNLEGPVHVRPYGENKFIDAQAGF